MRSGLGFWGCWVSVFRGLGHVGPSKAYTSQDRGQVVEILAAFATHELKWQLLTFSGLGLTDFGIV